MNSPLEGSPAWMLVPSPIRRRRNPNGEKTWAEDAQFLLDTAHRQTVPATTSLMLDRAFSNVLQCPGLDITQSLERLRLELIQSRLIDRRFDFHLLHNERSDDGAKSLREMLDDRLLPLLVTGIIEPARLPTSEEVAKTLKTKPRSKILRSAHPQGVVVWDGSCSTEAKLCPRPALREEFVEYIINGRKHTHYLSFSGAANETAVRVTPQAITELSLEGILRRKASKPYKPLEMVIAATMHAVSAFSESSMGAVTWFRPIRGATTYYIPTDSVPNVQEAVRLNPVPQRYPASMEFCAVNIDTRNQGLCWILPPGQRYWTYTSETALLVCGFFYTAELFSLSVRAIRYQLCEPTTCVSRPTVESFSLLIEIFETLLGDDEVFTSAQRLLIFEEVEILLSEWAHADKEKIEWYEGVLKAHCEEFILAVRQWRFQNDMIFYHYIWHSRRKPR